MADYNRSEAFDYYAVPAYEPSYEERTAQPKRKPNKKSAIQVRRETLASALRALKIFAVAVTIISLFGAILYSRVGLAKLEREAVTLTSQIKDAESENTRLVMQLNSSISRENVEEYAVTVLGMQKLERYQIHYFSDDTGDKVVMAGGELAENKVEADRID
ncbi:MAG: hypothetical protein J6R20_01335 [Clostridia bacterium]|jgi:cell division protein FtsL|nr:hypothetical protein [Clostridia bacterium]